MNGVGGQANAAGPVPVPDEQIREHAERLVTKPVARAGLALGFSESSAADVEVLVEGSSFYPRMLEDLAGATSSIHINQFGFRPGIIGESFAEALAEKARQGVVVRLVVDRQGSDPERGSRELYERLTGAGVHVCVVRATKARAAFGPLGDNGATRWNLRTLGHIDHRKLLVIDGRLGWIGGAGIEDHFQDGRFHDSFSGSRAPLRRSSSSSFWRASIGCAARSTRRSSTPSSPLWTAGTTPSRPEFCTTRPAVTGR